MTIRTSARREAISEEFAADAEKMPNAGWAKVFLRDPGRHIDAWMVYLMSHDLQTVYLRRWSPETRALIVAARKAVGHAHRAMYQELP